MENMAGRYIERKISLTIAALSQSSLRRPQLPPAPLFRPRQQLTAS